MAVSGRGGVFAKRDEQIFINNAWMCGALSIVFVRQAGSQAVSQASKQGGPPLFLIFIQDVPPRHSISWMCADGEKNTSDHPFYGRSCGSHDKKGELGP